MGSCRKRGHASGWIAKALRLALYRRDSWTCVYCGEPQTIDSLTLDHVEARVNGGHNHPSNLVTACRSCNSSLQDQDLAAWCLKKGLDYEAILRRIRNAKRRLVP